MSSIQPARGVRVLWKTLSCIVIATVAMAVTATPAHAAAPTPAPSGGISIQSITSCTAIGPLQSCRTNAIQADPTTHCVTATLSGVGGYGNIYEPDFPLDTRVGPGNFFVGAQVCGLYGWYYLEVRSLNTFGLIGVLSS